MLHTYEGVPPQNSHEGWALLCLTPRLTSLAKSKEIMDDGLWMVGIEIVKSHTHTHTHGHTNTALNGRLVIKRTQQERTSRLLLWSPRRAQDQVCSRLTSCLIVGVYIYGTVVFLASPSLGGLVLHLLLLWFTSLETLALPLAQNGCQMHAAGIGESWPQRNLSQRMFFHRWFSHLK